MRSVLWVVPRRPRLRWWGAVVAVVAAAGALGAAPGVAGAQDACPEANPTYTSNCGPTFVVPAWGDAGGWTDPSKYSTIQLADFNGDRTDELMARNDQGIEIYWFDTSLGQWRPQVDGNGVQQVITDFRSPLPSENPATDWTQPEYYSTIQTAHINGAPSARPAGRKRRRSSRVRGRDARVLLQPRAWRQHQRRLVVDPQQAGPLQRRGGVG